VIDMADRSDSPTPRIVVGVDGSEPSRKALRWAASAAEATGATVDALTVWHLPVSYGWSFVPDEWNPSVDATHSLNKAVDAAFPDGRPSRLNLVVKEGVPAKVLLEESKTATLLVLGCRGHGGVAGLLLGSVSANCAEHASCPVLVVHGDKEPPPLIGT
jgi:nucleotide-binding universal stress UspA family protein